ncbi:hypothetical protein AX14_001206 [Amanita brunnescens Koide BX004]|nr:hypothetical protein AX14_001206 [Amanita brunnescens Koide BX004]
MSLPSSVEAITIAKTGDIDVIEKTTQPFPTVNPGDIVIKVEYAGVNFIDTYQRSGLYPVKKLPTIIGKETAGTIVTLPTDESVLNNETFKKSGYRVGGKAAADYSGTHATYISVPWEYVYPVPESVSTRTAAASTLQGLTAVSFVEEAYNIQKGDIIFIHTVAGGLGLLLCQLAKMRGAIVIGTTSTEDKAKLARANGADHVILYRQEDTVQRVLEITNGEGVHAVYDGVGKDTFDNDFKLIRRKGTIVALGNASGPIPPFSIYKLAEKNVKVLRPTQSNYTFTPEEKSYYGNKLFDLISNESLKISTINEYPFTAEGYKRAHSDLTGGKTVGKLVIKVTE